MFSGLSAFPLTPMRGEHPDEQGFIRLVTRLAEAGVQSIGALGSTGNYAYLTLDERLRLTRLAVEHAAGVPVMVSVGAVRTRDVLTLAEGAQQAGVSALLLAPVSYQPLTQDEVFSLYQTVAQNSDVPLCVYDNAATTHFTFTDALYSRLAALPAIGSIKLPGAPLAAPDGRERLAALRAALPQSVKLGVSGDMFAQAGLSAGCDLWYSVVGGLYPRLALRLMRHAQEASAQSAAFFESLAPLWALFSRHGSLRVIAALAVLSGLLDEPPLPAPLKMLPAQEQEALRALLPVLDSWEAA